jgi:hypothetical protein
MALQVRAAAGVATEHRLCPGKRQTSDFLMSPLCPDWRSRAEMGGLRVIRIGEVPYPKPNVVEPRGGLSMFSGIPRSSKAGDDFHASGMARRAIRYRYRMTPMLPLVDRTAQAFSWPAVSEVAPISSARQ